MAKPSIVVGKPPARNKTCNPKNCPSIKANKMAKPNIMVGKPSARKKTCNPKNYPSIQAKQDGKPNNMGPTSMAKPPHQIKQHSVGATGLWIASHPSRSAYSLPIPNKRREKTKASWKCLERDLNPWGSALDDHHWSLDPAPMSLQVSSLCSNCYAFQSTLEGRALGRQKALAISQNVSILVGQTQQRFLLHVRYNHSAYTYLSTWTDTMLLLFTCPKSLLSF